MSFPNYKQLDKMDCGPTCIQIIAKYYGKFFSLLDIRSHTAISKEGLSLYELGNTAERMGLKSLSVKVSYETLHKKIPLPCIAYWDEKHYVVIYKIKKNKIYLSDPALGLMTYGKEEFLSHWLPTDDSRKGILLLLEPTDKFNEIKASKNPSKIYAFNYFISHLKPYKKQSLQLLGTMIILTLLQASFPFITQSVVDIGITSKDMNFITLLLLANIVLVISTSIGTWIRQSINIHIASRVKISILSNYILKLLNLPLLFFENKQSGDIFQRALDYNRLEGFIMNSAFVIIISLLNLIVFSIILLFYQPFLALTFYVGGILYILWTLLFWNVRKKLDTNFFALQGNNNSQWIELLSHIQEIKNNNYEQSKRWSWERVQVKLYEVGLKMLTVTQFELVGSNLINSLTDISLTFLTVYFVIKGEITFGMMIATQFIIGQLKSPLMEIIRFITSYQSAYLSFIRMNEVNLIPNEQEQEESKIYELPIDKTLELKNIYFKYNNSNTILSHVSLLIPQGEITAIVGASGSGKSTLLKILTRLYPPTSGEYLIGKNNMLNFDLQTWRKHIGVVNQKAEVFKDTIKNNIILSKEYNAELFHRVLEAVNLTEELGKLPLGIHTLLGENGRGLSEGQKQRIIIARALYKEPEYLFLDEATNSLDSINEKHLVTNLNNYFIGKTVVIIAHRLATIKNAQNIIVMNKGNIVEQGNALNLLNKKGFYYHLFKNQLISTFDKNEN